MTEKIPESAFYNIKRPSQFYAAMRRDILLLREYASWTTCMTIALCCIDAIAAGDGEADRGKFQAFVSKHFPELCSGLDQTVRGKKGSEVLYDKFRNGFAHLRGPKSGFGIASGAGLAGRYVVEVEIENRDKAIFAVNVERFIQEFADLLDRLHGGAA